jgi:uncharacterized protein
MGNVFDAPSFAETLARHAAWTAGIARGVEVCRDTCAFFDMCGGGSPSNKLGEHGRFDVAETRDCRLELQAPVNAMTRRLRERVAGTSA